MKLTLRLHCCSLKIEVDVADACNADAVVVVQPENTCHMSLKVESLELLDRCKLRNAEAED